MITRWILYALFSIFTLIVVRGFYLWWTRIRPLQPSLELEWADDCKLLTTAKQEGTQLTFHQVRNFTWRTTKDRDEAWEESVVVDVNQIKDVWFIVDHFHAIRGLAHTYLTFDFHEGPSLSFSFETRREKGESYTPWKGLWRAYELYLLVGFERDVTGLRTNARKNKDFMFRAQTPPGKDRELLLSLVSTLNGLAESPRWYHSITATCNTSIVKEVNSITPGRIPFLWRNFLPGHTPRAALKLNLIEDWGGYEMTLQKARIDEIAQTWDGKRDFSELLRDHLPTSSKK